MPAAIFTLVERAFRAEVRGSIVAIGIEIVKAQTKAVLRLDTKTSKIGKGTLREKAIAEVKVNTPLHSESLPPSDWQFVCTPAERDLRKERLETELSLVLQDRIRDGFGLIG